MSFQVTKFPGRGVRIIHGEFVEWPMVTRDKRIKLVQYAFDGERSSGVKWEELPTEVRIHTAELLQDDAYTLRE